jgi:hypothetical protein
MRNSLMHPAASKAASFVFGIAAVLPASAADFIFGEDFEGIPACAGTGFVIGATPGARSAA